MDRDAYYMNMAIAVGKKANCLGRKVGAIIVKENRIISTGYNGTPRGDNALIARVIIVGAASKE